MPCVSVILLNWNGVHLLPTCLASLRKQTLQDFEIIVPDNGSTDGSRAFLAEQHPDVQVIRFDRNMGFCLAMNAGMRRAAGEFVFALNNDTELDPRCLEELVAVMRAKPEVGTCATKMVYYDEPGLINSAGHACNDEGVVVDLGRRQRDSAWFDQPREVLGACAGACLYRKTMLDEIGLYDPDFFISYEDIDIGWRAQLAGWRARYVPTAVVRHLPSIWHGWRSRMRWLFTSGYGSSLPAVIFSALALTPRMLVRRRRIQRMRRVGKERFVELLALGARHTRVPPED
jgi:GT2 family glycosyltransferase